MLRRPTRPRSSKADNWGNDRCFGVAVINESVVGGDLYRTHLRSFDDRPRQAMGSRHGRSAFNCPMFEGQPKLGRVVGCPSVLRTVFKQPEYHKTGLKEG